MTKRYDMETCGVCGWFAETYVTDDSAGRRVRVWVHEPNQVHRLREEIAEDEE